MTYEPPEQLENEVNEFYDPHFFESGSFSDPYDNVPEVTSDSKIKKVYRCHIYGDKGQFFGYGKVPKGFMAAESLFFQQTRKRMHDVNDPEIGRLSDEIGLRAGPDLTYIEDMTAEELKKYLPQHSPEHFGRVVASKWGWFARSGEYAGNTIAWNNDWTRRKSYKYKGLEEIIHNPENKKRASVNMGEVARNYYDFVLQSGPAVMGYINSVFPFEFEGRFYSVKFPEIRVPTDRGVRKKDGWYIDDPTIQYFTSQLPLDKNGEKLENSPMITMRILGFCTLVHAHPWLGMKFGIPQEVIETWGGNPIWVDERVKYRHLNCFDNILRETTRNDSDLEHFREIIKGYDLFLKSANHQPNHEYCGACPINVITDNGDFACEKRNKHSNIHVPHFYFRKKTQEIVPQDVTKFKNGKPLPPGPGKNRVLRVFINKSEYWRKEVAQYQLNINDIGSRIIVKSKYHRTLIGISLEDKLLNALDAHLQDIADTDKKPVVHMINTAEQFSGTGVGSIRKQLIGLAYEQQDDVFHKLYEPGIKKRNKPKKEKKEKPRENAKPEDQIGLDLRLDDVSESV